MAKLAEEVLRLCEYMQSYNASDSTGVVAPNHGAEGDINGEMIKDKTDAQRLRKKKGLGA